jgi:tetratricopeptide (TPR) repeat protein
LGRVQAAQDAFQKISGGHVDRGYWLMVGSLARVDERYLAKLASVPFTNYGFLNYVAVSWAAHHGQMARADQIVRKMEANWDFLPAAARPGEVMLSRAEIFMARGARSKGIALMRQVVEKEDFLAPRTYFLAAESLARAWQEQGELELAIRLLEEASGKTSYVNSLNGFVWIRLHWQLVQLYRHAGQNEAAQRAEQELCKRLRYADPGHPILRHWK